MTIHVLGLGESLKEFKKDGNITIGVNDIHSRIKTDYVVCVDDPKAFKRDRFNTLLNTKCKGFYSQVDFWQRVQNFEKITFNNGRGVMDGFDNHKFCYSNNSTYVAVVLAYKLGAKRIILHGADFQTHPNFKSHAFDRVIGDFKKLNKELIKRGVSLFVGSSYSALSTFLPIYDRTEQS